MQNPTHFFAIVPFYKLKHGLSFQNVYIWAVASLTTAMAIGVWEIALKKTMAHLAMTGRSAAGSVESFGGLPAARRGTICSFAM